MAKPEIFKKGDEVQWRQTLPQGRRKQLRRRYGGDRFAIGAVGDIPTRGLCRQLESDEWTTLPGSKQPGILVACSLIEHVTH